MIDHKDWDELKYLLSETRILTESRSEVDPRVMRVNELVEHIDKALAEERYHLVTEDNVGEIELATKATLPELANELKSHTIREESTIVKVFVFHGQRLTLSKGKLKHLLIPGGDPVPLFAQPSLDPDLTGKLDDEYEA